MKTSHLEPASAAYGYPLIIRQILEGALETQTQAEIIGSDGRRLSYGDFADRVARLAGVLDQHGVRPGETVAVLDWDSHRYLECYFAIPMMGAVLQTVNIRLSHAQLTYTLKSTGARTVLFHRDFAPMIAALEAELGAFDTLIVLDDEADVPPLPFAVSGRYETLLETARPFAFVDLDENAIATTFHTTGTTGAPKAVAFSHRQLVLHALSAMAAFALQPDSMSLRRDDVYMPLTPMFHVHAWGVPFVATMLGIKQVYPGRYRPDRLVALRRDESVTFSHCVPTVLRMLIEAIDAPLLSPWKLVIGGAALSPALRDAALEKHLLASAGYGMSETGPLIALARSNHPDEACRAGRLAPLVRARIVDEAMREQPLDDQAQGELVLRAPWLTQAYANDAEASEVLWRDGWLHTQDVATRAPNGDIAIRDRIKDLIKSGGEWISSIEMEALALEIPGVEEAAFIAAPSERWSERPVAILAASQAEDGLATSALDHFQSCAKAGRISRYAVPEEILIVDALPRTSVGKIDKRVLRQGLIDRTSPLSA